MTYQDHINNQQLHTPFQSGADRAKDRLAELKEQDRKRNIKNRIKSPQNNRDVWRMLIFIGGVFILGMLLAAIVRGDLHFEDIFAGGVKK